jgi:ferredoxin
VRHAVRPWLARQGSCLAADIGLLLALLLAIAALVVPLYAAAGDSHSHKHPASPSVASSPKGSQESSTKQPDKTPTEGHHHEQPAAETGTGAASHDHAATAPSEETAAHDHGTYRDQPVARPITGLAALLLALTGVSLAFLYTHPRPEPASAPGLDLLQLPGVKRFVRWKYFQPILQAPNLVLLALVLFLGFFDIQEGGRNFATKITWTIWWAAIIFAFVFAGRLWCAMCPYGALTLWASRLFRPLRRAPVWMRNVWLATFAFLLLTWADVYFGIVGSPSRTAWLVLIVSLSAITVGALFQRATFCRHLCPIGGLIGLYSMSAPLALRSHDPEICASCRTKSCYRGNERSHGCIMFEFPGVMDRNTYCNLCGECVKACEHDNIVLRTQPFLHDAWAGKQRRLDEAFLAIALVALVFLVTGHMVSPWHDWMAAVERWLPFGALGIVDEDLRSKLTFTAVYFAGTLLVAPLLLLAASWATVRLSPKGSVTLRKAFVLSAYMFIPIGLALHLAHNLLHLLKEAPGVIPVVQRAVNEFTPLNAGTPNWDVPALMDSGWIYALQMLVLAAFYVLALYAGWRLAMPVYGTRSVTLRAMLPMFALALGFTLLNVMLLSQPMIARHMH